MKLNQKYYNPYPFPVRILNDLGETFTMVPQDYSKVLNGHYGQSKLTLPPQGEEREFRGCIEINLESCTKSDLVPIAWAVGLDDVDQSMMKADMIDKIKNQIGEGEATDIESEENPSDPDLEGIMSEESTIDDDTDDENPHGLMGTDEE